MANDGNYLFSGLKVLDVGTWIAGPVATTILGDFGASVIKVETPGVGDPYRALANGPLGPQAPMNYMWLADGRNKRSITLNLKTQEARDILLRLVRDCDVYVTNQPFATRRAFGLTYADLAPLNERMIYASLTAYGEEGPDAELEGFDGVAWWARTGLMDLVRAQGATPGMSVPGMGDHPTAVAVYAMIVTALMNRERTGKGTRVHTSLLANGVWANLCYAQAAMVEAEFPDRSVVRPLVSPNRVLFETSDGRLLQLYMVRTHAELDALLVAAGREDLLADPRFGDHSARPQHAPELVDELKATLAQRTAADWMRTFREHGVPVTLVAQTQDLLHDPQVHANRMAVPPSDPTVAAPLIVNHPLNIDGLARVGPTRAPGVGEHTAEVLAELGYSEAQVADFRARGAL
jgi:crotonobetainyl-CoA:carnitine CoA-transferase CaiB-like acyl-CoA transferase